MSFIVGKTMKTVVFLAAVLPQGSGLESLNSRVLESLAVRDRTVEMEPGHFIFPKVIPPEPAPFLHVPRVTYSSLPHFVTLPLPGISPHPLRPRGLK